MKPAMYGFLDKAIQRPGPIFPILVVLATIKFPVIFGRISKLNEPPYRKELL
jgi:hypothetical protein